MSYSYSYPSERSFQLLDAETNIERAISLLWAILQKARRHQFRNGSAKATLHHKVIPILYIRKHQHLTLRLHEILSCSRRLNSSRRTA